MITHWVLFLSSVVVLVSLLVADVMTGLRGARKAHLILVSCTIPTLLFAIYEADSVGRYYTFGRTILTIHLTLAKSATLAVIPVAGSGIWLLRTGRCRRVHFWIVMGFLALAAAASVTGALLFTDATPKGA